jgi:hypothetical protein
MDGIGCEKLRSFAVGGRAGPWGDLRSVTVRSRETLAQLDLLDSRDIHAAAD